MNTATAAQETAAAPVLTTISIPPVNAYWPGQGGKFRGIVRGVDGARDYLLIEHVIELPVGNWQSAIDAAAAVEADEHKDFSLPNRAESALLYANAKDEHETDNWYWTSEPNGSDYAWLQHFYDGYQSYWHQDFNYRACAVRRIPI
jgi:hypothetical protein